MAAGETLISQPKLSVAKVDETTGYITNIDDIRDLEYPALRGTTYLDHAGTTLYAKSLIEAYSKDLLSNVFGNPHSASSASQLSSRRIEDVRVDILKFFKADPDDFDIIFVANATAAIKLVGDALRDQPAGFKFSYHIDSHTSLIGLRELAAPGSVCFSHDHEVSQWLDGQRDGQLTTDVPTLFAYPGQSNMTGRRLPLNWCKKVENIRRARGLPLFTLLDAAALASTSALDFSDSAAAPDFTALSFYKIFGFPPLGALIVRKTAGDLLQHRRYFGGGTVDSVIVGDDQWHAKKESSLHSRFEDGTVAFQSIIALKSALKVHQEIYGSMTVISKHASHLAATLRHKLQSLRHTNGTAVCQIYTGTFSDGQAQGPTVAFNLRDEKGQIVSNNEVEKLGIVKSIQFRTGGLCNPGGIASHLGLSATEMRQNYAAGHRCGSANDVINGKPTGAIRVSFGAMSSMKDVTAFVDFIEEFYVHAPEMTSPKELNRTNPSPEAITGFVVESLSVFPIKSCAAYKIPSSLAWEVGPKGLAWDREWCLVHAGTYVALSQKKYPRMALIQPEIDLNRRILRLSFQPSDGALRTIEVNLDWKKESSWNPFGRDALTANKMSIVCGEDVDVNIYTSQHITSFFSEALEVPCTLARFPQTGTVRKALVRVPGKTQGRTATEIGRAIALSNESPILLISRSSVNRLNEHIKQHNGQGGGVSKAVAAAAFRGNIVIAEDLQGDEKEHPYAEDEWSGVQIGDDPASAFEMLGPCQRCQMVCVDQKSAQRRQEPYSTLAKTRRTHGRVWFGMHMCLMAQDSAADEQVLVRRIRVGDRVIPRTGALAP